MFILPKNLPGVTVRPLISLAGNHIHNEVFMDDVRLHKKYLLGQKNQGFYQLLNALETDRFWGRFVKPPFSKSLIEDLVQYTKETKVDGKVLADDALVRHKLAESAIETEANRIIFWNAGWKMCNGQPYSMLSTMGTLMADEMGQRLFNKAMQIMGPYSQMREDPKWAPLRGDIQKFYLYSFGHTLAGGGSEILRNTIATVGLGLPRS